MTYQEGKSRLKELADKEFLEKLIEVGKISGWSVDYVEIVEFITNLHNIAGLPVPDLNPYEFTE